MTSLRLPLTAFQETLELEYSRLISIVQSRCSCLYDINSDIVGSLDLFGSINAMAVTLGIPTTVWGRTS